MRRLFPSLLLAAALPAADRWIEYRSGSFEVLTNAGERAGRETLGRLEQFSHALAQVSGGTELQTSWPIRIVVFKDARQQSPYSSPAALGLARDSFTGSLVAAPVLPRPLMRELAPLLLASGAGQPLLEIEEGLTDLFSTLLIDGTRITLGQPPPPAERTNRWAMAHMLAVTTEYYGKLRVLVRNLERGVDEEPAYRNSVGKTRAEIEKEAAAYLAAGAFGTVPVSGKPLAPERDFKALVVDAARQPSALVDLLLANPARAAEARKSYLALRNDALAEAHEGLGLLALRGGRNEEASEELAAAVQANTQSARALVEYARLQTDATKAVSALEQAAKRNARWAAPHRELARLASEPAKKLDHLRSAVSLEPRNPDHWIALAGAALAAEQFNESEKAWASAERAAHNTAERERIRKLRVDARQSLEEQKVAAKRREEEEKRREIERLRDEAMARVKLAEAKANVASPPPDPNRKVEEWWDDPRPRVKLRGVLQKIDCLGKRYRLIIEGGDRKLNRLLVPDPARIVLLGGAQTFACGPQKPPRKIAVEYYAAPDAKLGTAGEAALLEFL
jgi:tetratricopeptide (TPR) repeat protein